jgi:hypothetical protein
VVDIKKKKKGRSNEQNARLFGYLYPSLSKHFGYDVDTLHNLLRFKFLKDEKIVNYQSMSTVKSTTSLSVQEMNDYMTQIESWAIDMGWTPD